MNKEEAIEVIQRFRTDESDDCEIDDLIAFIEQQEREIELLSRCNRCGRFD